MLVVVGDNTMRVNSCRRDKRAAIGERAPGQREEIDAFKLCIPGIRKLPDPVAQLNSQERRGIVNSDILAYSN